MTKAHPRWTQQEHEQLRQPYPTMDRQEIAAQLRRPMSTVKAKIQQLGLKKRVLKPWQPEELQLVQRLYPTLGPSETAAAVGRPRSTVKAMAVRLGLKMDSDPRVLPVGTERMVDGFLFRKVSLDQRGMANWRPVSQLEESPEVRELFRLLQRINRETAALAKQRPSRSCASTC
jgi:hypothetical protein